MELDYRREKSMAEKFAKYHDEKRNNPHYPRGHLEGYKEANGVSFEHREEVAQVLLI